MGTVITYILWGWEPIENMGTDSLVNKGQGTLYRFPLEYWAGFLGTDKQLDGNRQEEYGKECFWHEKAPTKCLTEAQVFYTVCPVVVDWVVLVNVVLERGWVYSFLAFFMPIEKKKKELSLAYKFGGQITIKRFKPPFTTHSTVFNSTERGFRQGTAEVVDVN